MWLHVKNYLWSAKVFLQLWLYLKFHYIEDFEELLIRAGCRVVVSKRFKVYHFPRGGKIIVEDDAVEIIPASVA
jgi:hypothetical protein